MEGIEGIEWRGNPCRMSAVSNGGSGSKVVHVLAGG